MKGNRTQLSYSNVSLYIELLSAVQSRSLLSFLYHWAHTAQLYGMVATLNKQRGPPVLRLHQSLMNLRGLSWRVGDVGASPSHASISSCFVRAGLGVLVARDDETLGQLSALGLEAPVELVLPVHARAPRPAR